MAPYCLERKNFCMPTHDKERYMAMPVTMKIYGDAASGNCQKVRFVADHLGLPYMLVPIDTM
jgi:glutathione S-transferase